MENSEKIKSCWIVLNSRFLQDTVNFTNMDRIDLDWVVMDGNVNVQFNGRSVGHGFAKLRQLVLETRKNSGGG